MLSSFSSSGHCYYTTAHTPLPLSLPLFNTSVLSTARSSRPFLHDVVFVTWQSGHLIAVPCSWGYLLLQHLPVASARQLGIIVGCVSDGIVKYTPLSELNGSHSRSLLFELSFAFLLGWLFSRLDVHQSTFLTFIYPRNWLCATVTVVHADAQRRSSTAHSTALGALAVLDALNCPQREAPNADAGLQYDRPGR